MSPSQRDRFGFLFVVNQSRVNPKGGNSKRLASIVGKASSIIKTDDSKIVRKAARRLADAQVVIAGLDLDNCCMNIYVCSRRGWEGAAAKQ